MEVISITKCAASVLRDESLRGDLETGGLVFGYPRGRVIDSATRPGPKAVKRACSFSADLEFQKRAMEAINRESAGRAKQMGMWHRHLGLMSHPSSGDQNQARQIANDFAQDPSACQLIVIITNVRGHRPKRQVLVHAYVYDPDATLLVPARVALVPDDAPVVLEARRREPPTLGVREADFFNDLEFRFQQTRQGSRRLAMEVAELRAEGLHVDARQRQDDGRMVLVLSVPDGKRCVVIPPREYPLNPPRLFELPSGREFDGSDCTSIRHWSSDRKILDIVRAWLLSFGAGTSQGESGRFVLGGADDRGVCRG